MKKNILILFFITLLCLPITTKALATNSSYNNIIVYLFYNDDCKKCDKAKEWLEEELKDNSHARTEYIKIEDNKDLDKKVRDFLKLKKEKAPLLVIGSNYFLGFGNGIKRELKKAIESYEGASSFCDAVSKLRYDEDTNGCLEENKGIYKKSNIILPILLVIIVIGAVIGIVLFLKNKNKKK